MNSSEQQIHNEFHGQLVNIIKKNGEILTGIIVLTTGLKNPQTIPVKTNLISVDVILNISEYKQKGVQYPFKRILIEPNDIDQIRLNKYFYPPVQIEYNVFKDLNLGLNPTSKWEITENIKDNQVYTVNHQNVVYKLTIDEEDNLLLKVMD